MSAMSATEVDQRLAALERQVTRLRWGWFAAGLVALAALVRTGGAPPPAAPLPDPWSSRVIEASTTTLNVETLRADVIRGHALELVDRNERVRLRAYGVDQLAELSLHGSGGSISFLASAEGTLLEAGRKEWGTQFRVACLDDELTLRLGNRRIESWFPPPRP